MQVSVKAHLRGPYRQQGFKQPRQTLHNRKRKRPPIPTDPLQLHDELSQHSSHPHINDELTTVNPLQLSEVPPSSHSVTHKLLCKDVIPSPSCQSDSAEHLPHIDHSDLVTNSLLPLDPDTNADLLIQSSGPSGSEEELPQYLFNGSTVTTESAHLLLNSFACHHHLSGQAQTDMLHLLQLLLPKPNALPPSLYLFRKRENRSGEIVRHYFCSRCFTLVRDPETTQCPSSSCQVEFKMNPTNYFVELPIEEQLKTLLMRKCYFILTSCILVFLTTCKVMVNPPFLKQESLAV